MIQFKDFLKLRVFRALLLQRSASIELEQGSNSQPLVGNVLALAKLGRQDAPAAKTTSATLTVAEVLGGLITGNQGGAAAATYTTPTGAALEVALRAQKGDLRVGDSFELTIVNISTVAAETITLAGGVGVTITGDATMACITVGDQSSGTFRFRRTAADTFIAYRL